MTRFIVRIVLHGATEEYEYAALHEFMMAAGFARSIAANNGQTYHLPPTMYLYEGFASLQQVKALADNAAKKTGDQHAVLAIEYTSAMWSGLSLQARHLPKRTLRPAIITSTLRSSRGGEETSPPLSDAGRAARDSTGGTNPDTEAGSNEVPEE